MAGDVGCCGWIAPPGLGSNLNVKGTQSSMGKNLTVPQDRVRDWEEILEGRDEGQDGQDEGAC